MYECEYCNDTFSLRDDLDDHLDDYDHWVERETCNRDFRSHQACDQHMDATEHWAPSWPCETCDATSYSQSAMVQHMNALGHYRNYCKACDRHFQNENNLRAHLNFKLHRGRPTLCPFCKSNYTTASGLFHHLETGSCTAAPSMDRESIYRPIRARDPHGNGRYAATSQSWNGYNYKCYLCHRYALAGLFNHLESESCGYMRFEKVQRRVRSGSF
ncbi:hypothetical protein BDW74DRAFT_186870 [Aspergillus multicolor]|uniref:C2H2-type zinc finger protein n=1 Tax=Aspergillus multicolor TaxID=41759 RepID=UPI003CCD6781